MNKAHRTMEISIDHFPRCGFGNRILYYYNLRQEAYKRDCNFCCAPWDGHQFFEGDMLGTNQGGAVPLDFCLGERFYSYNGLSTRDIFKLKEKPIVPESTCAIHFRGTDFHQWNRNAILGYDYYYDSIQEVKDGVDSFALFTDDPSLSSFTTTKEYLSNENINFTEGGRENYINDFSFMSECDYIISSPSTFCICTGFIGKKKKIMHSKGWVEDRANQGDKFWIDLLGGGSEDYSAWRLL